MNTGINLIKESQSTQRTGRETSGIVFRTNQLLIKEKWLHV